MKLVILDCDGTLVDSQNGICAAMEHAFQGLGLGRRRGRRRSPSSACRCPRRSRRWRPTTTTMCAPRWRSATAGPFSN